MFLGITPHQIGQLHNDLRSQKFPSDKNFSYFCTAVVLSTSDGLDRGRGERLLVAFHDLMSVVDIGGVVDAGLTLPWPKQSKWLSTNS